MEIENGASKKRKRKDTIEETQYTYFHFLRREADVKNPNVMKNMYKCILCNEIFNGTKKSNLNSHLKRCHKREYSEITNDDSIAIQRLKLLQHLTEIVSVNGRPFNSLLDSGFQKIIEEKLNFLKQNGHALNLKDNNLTEVKNHLSTTAKKIKEKITSEVNDQPVSLMVDVVTKNNRSILGVSIQYVFNENLRIRSIGMIELMDSHTGIYLSTVIINRLREYAIDLKQIIVITTDNGSNVRKMVRDVDACLQQDINTVKSTAMIDNMNSENDENIDEEIAQILATSVDTEDDATGFSIFEDVELKENEALLSSISIAMHADGLEYLYDITNVNCAEHTLQLAIKDALKRTSCTVQNVIELCRRACKFLRLNTTSIEIKKAGIEYIRPCIENDTRWGTLYLMALDILKCEEMIKFFATTKNVKMLQLLLNKWLYLKEIVYLLRILYETTVAFQCQKLTLSDVYGRWLTTQLHLKQCTEKKSYKTGLAQHLYDTLEERKRMIFENPFMYAAIFLDPRFQIEITKDESNMEKAKDIMLKIWRRLNILNTSINDPTLSNTQTSLNALSFDFNPEEALAQHLGKTNQTNDKPIVHTNNESDIEAIIDAFQPELMPFNASVIKYWQSAKKDHPELHKLASVIFSIPPTEVQIERDFSSLNFVFSDRRCSLSRERLEEIMLIHLNRDLFELVNHQDIELIREMH